MSGLILYKSKILSLQYQFIVKAIGGRKCEISCFTECDSLFRSRMVPYGPPLVTEESELDKKIEEMQTKIEVEESKFAIPCVKTFLSRRYFNNPPSFTTWRETFFDIKTIAKAIGSKEKKPRYPSKEEIEKVLQIIKPRFSDETFGLTYTWLGHACVLVRLNGLNIITDPVFSSRASPFQLSGPRRLVDPPCAIEELPIIDIVFISHDHYDHLDIDAIGRINQKSPDAKWFVPLGVDKLLQRKTQINNLYAMSWGETERINGKFTITCVPAQHWGSRTFLDIYSRLWSGWVITDGDKSFYFAGDTGFCKKEFLKIGHHFENGITLAAIPIGCYEPSAFMHPQHISPREAVAVHKMIKAKKSVAIHWGTYDMKSTEGFFGPIEDLKEAIEEGQLAKDEFIVISPGETLSA